MADDGVVVLLRVRIRHWRVLVVVCVCVGVVAPNCGGCHTTRYRPFCHRNDVPRHSNHSTQQVFAEVLFEARSRFSYG